MQSRLTCEMQAQCGSQASGKAGRQPVTGSRCHLGPVTSLSSHICFLRGLEQSNGKICWPTDLSVWSAQNQPPLYFFFFKGIPCQHLETTDFQYDTELALLPGNDDL